ncbi:MAG: FMN-binding protein, partial [Eubacteriales bacterium]|nr:FMN-binding protein [Eubacteriales bacterium]
KENSDVGADISVIINYLEDYLKNNTDVSGIDADAVSGATSTVNNFKIAAEKLYKDAGLAD